MGKFFRKGFDIDLEDSLTYPSAETICNIYIAISLWDKNQWIEEQQPSKIKYSKPRPE